MSPWYDTKVNYPFIAITPRFTLAWSGSTCYGVPSMNQIQLWENYSYLIRPCAKKKINNQ